VFAVNAQLAVASTRTDSSPSRLSIASTPGGWCPSCGGRQPRPILVTFADKDAACTYILRTFSERQPPSLYADVGSPDEHVPVRELQREVRREGNPRLRGSRLIRWRAEPWSGPTRRFAPGSSPSSCRQTGDRGVPRYMRAVVMNSRCRRILVGNGRFDEQAHDAYSSDWRQLAVSGNHAFSRSATPRPARLEEMIGVAETLGSETAFLRVASFDLSSRLIVDELTNYPAAGRKRLMPAEFDRCLGGESRVPSRYTSWSWTAALWTRGGAR
jgi:hypothetical protein